MNLKNARNLRILFLAACFVVKVTQRVSQGAITQLNIILPAIQQSPQSGALSRQAAPPYKCSPLSSDSIFMAILLEIAGVMSNMLELLASLQSQTTFRITS
ncbi:hypothetical protein CEXT_84691 [Caerostris extrusa]|uniref:Secreted protein n=1 Tax=Caerostris extrusa TaxID=172846 RepID=A0AAV4RIG2_CAEEX|nr:hypothetical protein CEXT_84691 [Caerostris extrusa]